MIAGKKVVKHSNSLFAICNSTLLHTHPEFTRIVFHGLRHSSATYQLMISGGDVKAVQGTTPVQAAPVEAEPTISVSALLELLKDADPAVKAQLRLALLT